MFNQTPPLPTRNAALDFTKGALVALMVVYHWGNYFLGDVRYFFDVLRFLTPSFILLSGATISLVSLPKYGAQNSSFHRRTVIRGLKLIALFTVLNLAIHALGLRRNRAEYVGLEGFFADIFDVYITGDSLTSSFRVLLPIAYLLVLSPVLLQIARVHRIAAGLVVILVCAAVQAAESFGQVCANAVLLSFGFLGIALVFVGFPKIDRTAQRFPIILPLYACFLCLMLLAGPRYWVQLLGVALNLLVIYGVGRHLESSHRPMGLLVLLGRYSLFGYVAQIGILQILRYLVRSQSPVWSTAALACAFVVLIATILVVDVARKRFVAADRIYQAIFA